MRTPVSPEKIRRLLRELGRRVQGPGQLFLVGGASALLEGWRSSTVDIDLKLDPEPAGIFEAIVELKNELDVNIELASPDQFVPALPDWKERSMHVGRFGKIDVFHYDFRAQALAKLARSHQRDLLDVEAMVHRGLITRLELADALEQIRDRLPRYPGLDAEAFAARVSRFVERDD